MVQQALLSHTTAFVGLGGGILLSGSWAYTVGISGDAATTRIPAYLGLSLALYIACARYTPRSMAIFAPPTVASGIALGVLLWGFGGQPQVKEYLDGCAQAMLIPVGPAMGTLGLLPYTYRGLLRATWRPMLMVCAIVAPAGLLATAFVGGQLLQLQAPLVASALPMTTTMGLAMTMDVGHIAKAEWIPLGPLFCGTVGMVAWPLLLRVTGLAGKTALVQGFALGSTSHVSSMAALEMAGHTLASEAAAMAFFLMGALRCLLLQVPVFDSACARLCRSDESPTTGFAESPPHEPLPAAKTTAAALHEPSTEAEAAVR